MWGGVAEVEVSRLVFVRFPSCRLRCALNWWTPASAELFSVRVTLAMNVAALHVYPHIWHFSLLALQILRLCAGCHSLWIWSCRLNCFAGVEVKGELARLTGYTLVSALLLCSLVSTHLFNYLNRCACFYSIVTAIACCYWLGWRELTHFSVCTLRFFGEILRVTYRVRDWGFMSCSDIPTLSITLQSRAVYWHKSSMLWCDLMMNRSCIRHCKWAAI